MRLDEAIEVTGGLSKPSKMPCNSFGISATECITGGKLREVKGSVCERCYAHRGFYTMPSVKAAHERRIEAIYSEKWVEAMILLINIYEGGNYFRWFDSGDLQSVKMLRRIVVVCEGTPTVKHWLPTQESGMIRAFQKAGGKLPANLTVRLSSEMIDGPTWAKLARELGVQTSSVVTSGETCKAHTTHNKCGACRNCWNKNIKNIAYPQK